MPFILSRSLFVVSLLVVASGFIPLAAQTVIYDSPAPSSSSSRSSSNLIEPLRLNADQLLSSFSGEAAQKNSEKPAEFSSLSSGAVASSSKEPPSSIEKSWLLPDLSSSPLWAPDYGQTTQTFSDLIRASAEVRENQNSLPADLPFFSDKPTVRSGDQGPNVAALIGRLRAWGYLSSKLVIVHQESQVNAAQSASSESTLLADENIFDPNQKAVTGPALVVEDVATPEVIEAVRDFQKANQLGVDGVAGTAVAQVINADPIREAAALRVWATAVDEQLAGAKAAGARYLVLVNIPSFTLHLLDTKTGNQVLESAVVVGRAKKRTPRFWTSIVNLKVSPDWTLPASIGHGRVPPGPLNPLGLMRFSTNNSQDIFLHDTNSHGLFASAFRAYSHGCVRVQNWPGLAQVLGGLNEDELSNYLADRRTEYLRLPEKTLVRIIISRVDLVKGNPVIASDPYDQGDLAIGEASLDGRSEIDPSVNFSPDPRVAPGLGDWGYRPEPSTLEAAAVSGASADTVGP